MPQPLPPGSGEYRAMQHCVIREGIDNGSEEIGQLHAGDVVTVGNHQAAIEQVETSPKKDGRSKKQGTPTKHVHCTRLQVTIAGQQGWISDQDREGHLLARRVRDHRGWKRLCDALHGTEVQVVAADCGIGNGSTAEQIGKVHKHLRYMENPAEKQARQDAEAARDEARRQKQAEELRRRQKKLQALAAVSGSKLFAKADAVVTAVPVPAASAVADALQPPPPSQPVPAHRARRKRKLKAAVRAAQFDGFVNERRDDGFVMP